MRRICSTILIMLLTAPATAADYPARVVGVSDGNTITVLRDGRTQVKIRLNGIDAPESAQPFGSRSKQSLSDLVFGQTVTVHERDVDRYGRTVADAVLPDGRNVNREQVRAGMAWWFSPVRAQRHRAGPARNGGPGGPSRPLERSQPRPAVGVEERGGPASGARGDGRG